MRELTLTDSLITAPVASALTLQYAKDHIRALGTTDDNLIAVWIDAATSYFQEQTGRQVMTATREAWLDAFPFVGASGMQARIELPNPPLQAVESVEYVASDGNVVSFDDGASPTTNLWTTSAPTGPYCRRGFVEPLYGGYWPIARPQTGAVRIRYRCGYGAVQNPVQEGGSVPDLVSGILCYLIAHFDTFRSAVHEARRGQVLELPYGVQMMMDGFKYSAYPTQELRAYGTRWGGWFGGFGGYGGFR